MVIEVNGNKKEMNDNCTLMILIKNLQLEDKVMAVAVNMQIIKQDKWSKCILKDTDCVELLDFVAGG